MAVPGRNGFGHGASNPYGNLECMRYKTTSISRGGAGLTVVLYLLVVLDRLS